MKYVLVEKTVIDLQKCDRKHCKDCIKLIKDFDTDENVFGELKLFELS